MVPAVPLPAEADFEEVARVPFGLSPCEKHGLTVRQSTVGHLPDAVRDDAGLVEQIPGGRGLGVLAGERLAVLFLARGPLNSFRISVVQGRTSMEDSSIRRCMRGRRLLISLISLFSHVLVHGTTRCGLEGFRECQRRREMTPRRSV
jgi:hypothetical protein